MLCFILPAAPDGGTGIVFRIDARRLAAIWLDSPVDSSSCDVGGPSCMTGLYRTDPERAWD